MHIGVVYPTVKRWPKMRWVACAFRRLGHTVTEVSSLDQLASLEADLVLFAHRGAGLNHADVIALSKKRQCPWVMWWFDLLAIEPGKPLAEQSTLQTYTSQRIWEPSDDLQVMRIMDVVFVKERGLLAQYRNLGVNAEYLDQGCPSWIGQCEHREIPEWDVLIFGNTSKAWKQRRHDVSDLIAAGFAVAWAGHAAGAPPSACLPLPWCPPAGLPALASRAAVVLSVSMRSDVEGYTSDRLWLAMGMGACVLARAWDGPPAGLPVRIYSTEAEMVLAVEQLRADRGSRTAQGIANRRWVEDNRTITRQCERLLERCKPLHKAKVSAGHAKGPAP